MMYTKALIIGLIAASATARPTDEDDDNHHEDHDHADVRQVADECFKLTGYSEGMKLKYFNPIVLFS